MPNVTVSPTITIDTVLFAQQRDLLAQIARVLTDGETVTIGASQTNNIIGLECLCDAIADSIEDSA